MLGESMRKTHDNCVVHKLEKKKAIVFFRYKVLQPGSEKQSFQKLLRFLILQNQDGDYIMLQRLLSSAGCAAVCWFRFDSDGLYVNLEVSSPYWFLHAETIKARLVCLLGKRSYSQW